MRPYAWMYRSDSAIPTGTHTIFNHTTLPTMTDHLFSRLSPRLLSLALLFFLTLPVYPQEAPDYSTRRAVERLMAKATPTLEYDTTMTSAEFGQWHSDVRDAMATLMRHPSAPQGEPKLLKRVPRKGYTLEKWESYPLEGSAVPFLLLIPDGVDTLHKAPAALCIPGFGQTKELLAGERAGNFSLDGDADPDPGRNAMALQLVHEGIVCLAVDNPCAGELSDNGYFDYLDSSRFLLEMGWSYLGLASWQDRVALDWLKTLPYVRPDRIIVSGFSLGTEPLMVLGVLDPSIYAFVYNDFMCRTRERALVMNKPDDKGRRAFPNSDEHLIPLFLTLFDFPDLVAALAPRPVICTEGGMDRDFRIISNAYLKAGAPQNFTYRHYSKYADPASRIPLDSLPSGIDRTEFFRLVNCDAPSHYFKSEHILPWLRTLLSPDRTLAPAD